MLTLYIVISGVLLRLLPHLPNFAPISAIGLFSGSHLDRRLGVVLPIIIIIISDYLLLYINPFGTQILNFNQVQPITALFHSTTVYVWGSFIISGLIGVWLKSYLQPSNITGASLLASIQFYLITNFGVWATGSYSRGLDGLLESYLMGLPFFRWTLLGDLFYCGAFFISYALAKRIQHQLA